MLGKSKKNREYVIEQSINSTLSVIQNDWKYIEPSNGQKINKQTNIELGNDPQPQLYNLFTDIGEQKNVAAENTEKVQALQQLLKSVREKGNSR